MANKKIVKRQTCLEKRGFECRDANLHWNKWGEHREYNKLLVDAEYEIRSEFLVE